MVKTMQEKRWRDYIKRRMETLLPWYSSLSSFCQVLKGKQNIYHLRTCLSSIWKAGCKFVTGKQVNGVTWDQHPGVFQVWRAFFSFHCFNIWLEFVKEFCSSSKKTGNPLFIYFLGAYMYKSSWCVFPNRELHLGLSREISELLWIERKRWHWQFGSFLRLSDLSVTISCP